MNSLLVLCILCLVPSGAEEIKCEVVADRTICVDKNNIVMADYLNKRSEQEKEASKIWIEKNRD